MGQRMPPHNGGDVTIDNVRRKRRATQLKEAVEGIRARLRSVDVDLLRIEEIAKELDAGIIHYVGVYKKDGSVK